MKLIMRKFTVLPCLRYAWVDPLPMADILKNEYLIASEKFRLSGDGKL